LFFAKLSNPTEQNAADLRITSNRFDQAALQRLHKNAWFKNAMALGQPCRTRTDSSAGGQTLKLASQKGEGKMSVQDTVVNAVDPDGKWLYRVGGISALAIGIGYIILIALYFPLGAPPSGAEPRLAFLAGNTAEWWAILGLSVLTDFLFVPLVLALYLALKGINRNAMLVATACVGLFVVLDLAITWTNYAALITLSGNYAAATTDAQRATFVTAANYPTAVLESSLLFIYNTLTLSAGILITGLVMRKGIFNKGTAYLGLATGIFGIIAVVGSLFTSALGVTIYLASALTTIWALFVGYRLYRLG
jgi:hypothetical protein